MTMPKLGRVAVIVLLALWCPRLSAAADLTLAWDLPSDGQTTGFVVFYGTAPRSYSQQVNVGYVSQFTVSGLSAGTTYYFAVKSYNAGGTLSDFSQEVFAATSSTAPPPISGLSLTSSLPSPQAVGTPLTWTAAATGGVTPYQFQWSVLEAGQWTVGAWTTAATWYWTPARSGDYYVNVGVRSAGSASETGERTQMAPFTVRVPQAASSVALTSSKPAPQPAGSTIVWTAAASGGAAPYQYRWWVYNGNSWSAATGWTTSSTWSWKAAAANSGYQVRVWVRGAGSTVDAPEAAAVVAFPITKKCQGAKCG
jgi:hypothetical protein